MNNGPGKRKREETEEQTTAKRAKKEEQTREEMPTQAPAVLMDETPMPSEPTLEENMIALTQRLPLAQRERLARLVAQMQTEAIESIDSEDALIALFERLFPEMTVQTRSHLVQNARANNDSASYAEMAVKGIVIGLSFYLGGPYMAALMRDIFPGIYGSLAGQIPSATDAMYDFLFVPLREHLSALAYHYGPTMYSGILMAMGRGIYGVACSIAEQSFNSLHSSRVGACLTYQYGVAREQWHRMTSFTTTETTEEKSEENANAPSYVG